MAYIPFSGSFALGEGKRRKALHPQGLGNHILVPGNLPTTNSNSWSAFEVKRIGLEVVLAARDEKGEVGETSSKHYFTFTLPR